MTFNGFFNTFINIMIICLSILTLHFRINFLLSNNPAGQSSLSKISARAYRHFCDREHDSGSWGVQV